MDRSHHLSSAAPAPSGQHIVMYRSSPRDAWHLCWLDKLLTLDDALLYVDRESEAHPGLTFQAFSLTAAPRPTLVAGRTDESGFDMVLRRCPNCREIAFHDPENGALHGLTPEASWKHLVSGSWMCEDVDTFQLPMTAAGAVDRA